MSFFHDMNIIDYLIYISVLVSITYGFWRGFIISAISTTGWILSIVLTYKFYPSIEIYFSTYLKSKALSIIIGSSILLLFLLVLFACANAFLYKLFLNVKKSPSNRVLGSVLGLFRGLLITSFLFFCLSVSLTLLKGKKARLSDKDYPKILSSAKTYPTLIQTTKYIESILPSGMRHHLDKIYGIDSAQSTTSAIENYIEKLSFYATKDEIDKINILKQDYINQGEPRKAKIKALEWLFDIYMEREKEDNFFNKIPQKELEEIEYILNSTN
tara:strand:+ start:979 stop:1791 length:813 start_codon:yes stop_codon:yes gene_type:complete